MSNSLVHAENEDCPMTSDWLQSGVLLIRGLLDPVRLAAARIACTTVRDKWLRCDPLTGVGSPRPSSETCMRHLTHPSYFDHKHTLNDLLELFVDDGIMRILGAAWGEQAIFRSTSLFFNPQENGYEGSWHRDTQFAHTTAASERMAICNAASAGGEGMQVQVPLLDDDSLEYVQDSHKRWDTKEERLIRLDAQGGGSQMPIPAASRIVARVGDVVFFDPNGIHRGRYRHDVLRLTIMITYTRSSARPKTDRFSYQPWMLSKGYFDGLSPRARESYQTFLDHYRFEWSANPIRPERFHSGRSSTKGKVNGY